MQVFSDERGVASVQNFDELPFIPKRVFILHHLNEKAKRGNHYHKVGEEFLFVISGRCEFCTKDMKTKKEQLLVAKEKTVLYVPTYTKIIIQNATEDCVIGVLCNNSYDPTDAYLDED